jgi:transposase
VPGIGNINGAMILSEIGDVRRFEKDSQLCRFAGLNPVIRQSGKWSARNTRMSKQGSSYLRYALINAAWNVCKNNQTFRDYYDLKVSQGHGHYSALGHVAHKLIRVLFKLLKSNTAFSAVKLVA